MTPISEKRAEDQRVFGLGLDADAVRALHVAAARSPSRSPIEEDDARDVGAGRVRLDTCVPCRNFSGPGIWWSISLITVAMNKHR